MELFAERRGRLLDALSGAAIFAAAPVTIRNNDVEHAYRQASDLYYLTGFEEPEAVLVLSKTHPEHRAALFVRPRDPEREVWDGPRAGVEGATKRCGVDISYPIEELAKRLPDYLTDASELVYELAKSSTLDEHVHAAINKARARGRSPKCWPKKIIHPEDVLHELRLVKTPSELSAMRKAAALTKEGHLLAMSMAKPGLYEYEIEAAMSACWRSRGSARVAYGSIVGAGPNATVLHYLANNRRLEDGELLLIDAGCEWNYYACDVTRTFPVNGVFSEAQRRLYEVVLDAQLAAIAESKPGSTVESIHKVCVRHLVDGMLRLGLLTGDAGEIIEKERFKRYYMHRTSHWLGMDVHDVGAYFVNREARPLAPGMVLTIEPGLYVAADDEQAPPELRGIGIRIEDDILITEDGHEDLTAAIPKQIDDVERACRG